MNSRQSDEGLGERVVSLPGSMMPQVLLVYVVVLVTITTLYHLRHVSFIGDYLSAMVAILLTYPALWHVQKRKLPVVFFEKTASQLLHSLKLFAATAGVVFPLFFLAAHIYQTQLFGMRLDFGGLKWRWEELVIQLFLVALPEEFFFRGYLQTMLATRFSKRFRPFGLKLLEVPWAVPLTCLIFAVSHSIITLRWWHFAIFFPSLVFGWLRERTNGLAAPVLFHTASNLVMNQIGHLYR